jgi:hypothetical protein
MYIQPGGRLGKSVQKLQANTGMHNTIAREDKMHLDLQKSAFGASFPAKRLGLLRKQLESNAVR